MKLTGKKFYGIVALMCVMCVCVLFAARNSDNRTAAYAEDTVLADFAESTTSLSQTPSGSAVDGAASPWTRYADPDDLNYWVGNLGSEYPMAFTWGTNISGANGENALSMNLAANQTTGGCFNVSFAEVDLTTIDYLNIRVLMHTGYTGTRLRIWRADGNEQFWESTEGTIGADTWYTIKLASSAVKALNNGSDKVSAISVLVQWDAASINAGTTANPSYVMFDEISTSIAAVSYNVTFDYAGKATNGTGVVNADPFKVTKPADPVVFGYDFLGWYADAEYKTAFDFDTAISADTTVYAKFEKSVMAEGVLTDFKACNTTLSQTPSGSAVDGAASPWTRYADPDDLNYWVGNLGSDYPMAFTWETNASGANGENALSMNLAANQTVGGCFNVSFAEVDLTTIDYLNIRVLMHTGYTGTRLRIWRADGNEQFWESNEETIGADTWYTIRLASSAVKALNNGSDKLSAISILVQWDAASINAGTIANPSYVLFDEINTSVTEVAYNVTFDYAGTSTNETAVVDATPFKVTKPADPVVYGYNFEGWYADAAYTAAFDFDAAISADTTVYGKFSKVVSVDGVATSFAENDVILSNAAVSAESYTEWKNFKIAEAMGAQFPKSGTEFVTGVEGSADGKVLKANFLGFSYTPAVGFRVTFNPIELSSIGKLTVRLFIHMDSDGESLIKLYNLEGTSYIGITSKVQDEWIEFNIPYDKLSKIISGESFSGFNIIVMLSGNINNGNYEDLYSAYWGQWFYAEPSYVYFDTVTYAEPRTVTFVNGENSTQMIAGNGDAVTIPAAPESEGKMFAGWTLNGETYDFATPVTEDITLTATFADETADYSAVYGVYKSAADAQIILNDDLSVITINGDTVSEYGYRVTADGKLVITGENTLLIMDYAAGSVTDGETAYAKADSYAVTYSFKSSTRKVYCLAGGKAIEFDAQVKGYIFDGWYLSGAEEAYSFDTEVNADIALEARFGYDEIADYSAFYGTYYYKSGKVMLLVKEGNAIEVISAGVSATGTYHLMNEGVGEYTVNGSTVEFEYNALYFRIEGNKHKLLGSYIVTMKNGESSQDITVNSGYYKITEPTAPTDGDKVFDGWYNADTGDKFTFDTVIDESLTLEARFVTESTSTEGGSVSDGGEQSSTASKGGCSSSASGFGAAALMLLALAVVAFKRR